MDVNRQVYRTAYVFFKITVNGDLFISDVQITVHRHSSTWVFVFNVMYNQLNLQYDIQQVFFQI